MFNNYFKGKKVLVTGHTGFKGSWLAVWLTQMGAQVTGFALPPKTERDHFVALNLAKLITDLLFIFLMMEYTLKLPSAANSKSKIVNPVSLEKTIRVLLSGIFFISNKPLK